MKAMAKTQVSLPSPVVAARVDGDVEFVHETDALDRATRRARQALPGGHEMNWT